MGHVTQSPRQNTHRVGRTAAPGELATGRAGESEQIEKVSGSPSRQLRIVLYSHDTMGLGHLRRNLLIAKALAQPPLGATILMITGGHIAGAFQAPPGVDYLNLPSVSKQNDGRYKPSDLHIPLQDLATLRAKVILAAVQTFKPDLFLVDKVPLGISRELEPALEHLRTQMQTRCVLGIRDILDDPDTVRREWRKAGNEDAIRDYYDAVWVYGDPAVYDPIREYGLSNGIKTKVHYVGYLDQSMRIAQTQAEGEKLIQSLDLPAGKLAVCVVGGGQDGNDLAEAFAHAELPDGTNGLIVGGPFMPEEVLDKLHQIAASRPRLRVLDFALEAALLVSRADRVVAMGGYNTVMEILSFNKRALVVPRMVPRMEQSIRAERLSEMGLLDVLHPDELCADKLTEWLARDMPPPPRACDLIDMGALARIPHLAQEVLAPLLQTLNMGQHVTGGEWQHVQ